jgi:hypothetical protein
MWPIATPRGEYPQADRSQYIERYRQGIERLYVDIHGIVVNGRADGHGDERPAAKSQHIIDGGTDATKRLPVPNDVVDPVISGLVPNSLPMWIRTVRPPIDNRPTLRMVWLTISGPLGDAGEALNLPTQ